VGFPDLPSRGAYGVSIGKFEKAIAHIRVRVGEAAATPGLLKKDCAIGLTRNEAGVPFGALSRRRFEVVAGNVLIVSILCLVGDSFSGSGRDGRGLGLILKGYILGVVIWVRSCDNGLTPARSRRPDGPAAQV
jgi:hypothetical protein